MGAAPNYEIWLTNDTGTRLRSLDDALWWSATRQVNRIGHFSMGLPLNIVDDAYYRRDNMIQIWRQPTGGRLGLWRVYFLRGWRVANADGREQVTIWGPDCNDLLRRRIVAYYAGEAEADYTATEADDLMKDLVTNAIADGTAPAPSAGTRVWDNFSVAVDLTAGPQLDKGCAWQPLLTSAGGGVLADLADASKEAGTEVFFDIVPDSVSSTSITFQFRTYTGQPGLDVSDRVVFTHDDRNLKDPFIEIDFGDEINYVYAGGQGDEDERNIQQVYNSDSYNASAWNRCEGFADARNQETDNGVREAGRQLLAESRRKIRAGGVPVDTAGTRFGLHWNHGDKVQMRYRGQQFDCIVRTTVVSMNGRGEETIEARLEYES